MNPKTEPVRLGALIIGVVGAILTLLAAFGADLSPTQQEAILGVVGAIVALAAALGVGAWIRRRVTPTADPKADDGARLVPEWDE